MFDKNLMEMFCQKYLQSNNASKRGMCFTFLDIDFRDNEYSDHDVKETIANLRELQNRLNNSEQNKKTALLLQSINRFMIKLILKFQKLNSFIILLKTANIKRGLGFGAVEARCYY